MCCRLFVSMGLGICGFSQPRAEISTVKTRFSNVLILNKAILDQVDHGKDVSVVKQDSRSQFLPITLSCSYLSDQSHISQGTDKGGTVFEQITH